MRINQFAVRFLLKLGHGRWCGREKVAYALDNFATRGVANALRTLFRRFKRKMKDNEEKQAEDESKAEQRQAKDLA
jgi:DTW domain-containing protein YfiP